MCCRWLNYLFMENRTQNLAASEGQNYSILCFIISTLIVFLLSLSVALMALRCYDYCKSRSNQVNKHFIMEVVMLEKTI